MQFSATNRLIDSNSSRSAAGFKYLLFFLPFSNVVYFGECCKSYNLKLPGMIPLFASVTDKMLTPPNLIGNVQHNLMVKDKPNRNGPFSSYHLKVQGSVTDYFPNKRCCNMTQLIYINIKSRSFKIGGKGSPFPFKYLGFCYPGVGYPRVLC